MEDEPSLNIVNSYPKLQIFIDIQKIPVLDFAVFQGLRISGTFLEAQHHIPVCLSIDIIRIPQHIPYNHGYYWGVYQVHHFDLIHYKVVIHGLLQWNISVEEFFLPTLSAF